MCAGRRRAAPRPAQAALVGEIARQPARRASLPGAPRVGPERGDMDWAQCTHRALKRRRMHVGIGKAKRLFRIQSQH